MTHLLLRRNWINNKKLPFEITNQIIDYVAETAELMGRSTVTSLLSTSPTFHRANHIHTIHGPLAIEQNPFPWSR